MSDHYKKLPWLSGCEDTKAFYCFACLLFPTSTTTRWNTDGFRDLSNLTKSAKKHSNNADHLKAATALSLLGKVRIDEELSSAASDQRNQYNAEVKRNRDFLEHHVRATIFLATQGLSFRGHEEDKDSSNRGNFVKILENFQFYSGNKRLADSLFHSSRPVFSGLSGDIQNELIECLYEVVMVHIKEEINNCRYVSLIADESTDVANTSQLAICLRYVTEGIVKERLVDLVDVSKDKSAVELSKAIKSSMDTILTNDAVKVIGQSYDGAANMAGVHNSVQKHLQDVWPHAKFVHCYAHKLALVIKQACSDINCAADFFETLSTICTFFRSSPKRGCLLEKRVPQAAYTRWLTRGKCVKYLHQHMRAIFSVLEELTDSGDTKTRCDARGILRQIKTWENMFLLHVFNKILHMETLYP